MWVFANQLRIRHDDLSNRLSFKEVLGSNSCMNWYIVKLVKTRSDNKRQLNQS
jgi:hypothetical protein